MKTFAEGFRAALAAIFRDRAAVATLIAAVVLYSFYYPAAYRHQVATRLPTIAVDLDHSPMSRALLRSRVGDVVVLQTPAGEQELEVLDVSYPAAEGGNG